MGDFTRYFDYRDFFVSDKFPDVASRMYERRKECSSLRGALYQLNKRIITPARKELGAPLRITSGVCNGELRRKLLEAGYPRSGNSLHFYGLAADITTWHVHDRKKLMNLFLYIKNSLHEEYCELYLYENESGTPINIHVSMHGFDKDQQTKRMVRLSNGKLKEI